MKRHTPTRLVDEVILCPTCKGLGKITDDELIDYHKREYRTKEYDCGGCEGVGRFVKRTITRTYLLGQVPREWDYPEKN